MRMSKRFISMLLAIIMTVSTLWVFPTAPAHAHSGELKRYTTSGTALNPDDGLKRYLIGHVIITGDTRYGSVLTADTSGLYSDPEGNLGALFYQWKRNDEDIAGATGNTYVLTYDDIGTTVSVEVMAANCLGAVSGSIMHTVEKGNQTAPVGLEATPVTAYGDNNGSISGLLGSTAYEYKRDNGDYISVTTGADGRITELEAGSYVVRLPETAVYNASPDSDAVTIHQPPLITEAHIPIEMPVTGAEPQLTIAATSQYKGTISWSGNPVSFAQSTVYTATVMLIADGGAAFDSEFKPNVDGGLVNNTEVGENNRSVTFDVTFPETAPRNAVELTVINAPQLFYVSGSPLNLSDLVVTVKYNDHNSEDLSLEGLTDAVFKIGEAVVTDGDILSFEQDCMTLSIEYNGCESEIGELTIITDKLPQEAPIAPELYTKNAVSVTLRKPVVVTGSVEFSNDGVNWQTEPAFSDLSLNTTYHFYMRLSGDGIHEPSPASAALSVTTDMAEILGNVAIEGEAKYGETLSADVTGISCKPEGDMGSLTYQWRRGETIIEGATGNTYTLTQEDVGKVIFVLVTAANCSGFVFVPTAGNVAKADSPEAPVVTGSYTIEDTGFIYTVETIEGAEYSKDGERWQDSCVFNGFSVGDTASFYARIKETDTHKVGEAGSTDLVTFTKYDNPSVPELEYLLGENRTSITITPVPGAEYKFGDDDWTDNNSKDGFIGTETVIVQIRFAETGTHNASPAEITSVKLPKDKHPTPPPFELEYTYNSARNTFTVSIPAITNCEYSFDGNRYVDTRTITLNPGDNITGYIRYKETDTHSASSPASASLILPYHATSIDVTGEDGINSITVKGGALQMHAAVYPVEASQAVIWSTSGSAASISADGLLTAKYDGAIIVRAVAADGSGRYGEAAVIISGQSIIIVPEITVKAAKNGSVSANPFTPSLGDEVTLTVTPDVGYEMGDLTITDENNDTLDYEENGDGTYIFTYGGNPVTVEVEFVLAEVPAPWEPFEDVDEDSWYHDDVKYVHENNIMLGTSKNIFHPDLTVTRGMSVTVLWRLAGELKPQGKNNFTDLKQDWYIDAVIWAHENSIVSGYDKSLFGPEDSVTREQLATMLYRYARWQGLDTSRGADLDSYTDADKISDWAQESLAWAVAEGLIEGHSATELSPHGTASRAELAAILHRFLEG